MTAYGEFSMAIDILVTSADALSWGGWLFQ